MGVEKPQFLEHRSLWAKRLSPQSGRRLSPEFLLMPFEGALCCPTGRGTGGGRLLFQCRLSRISIGSARLSGKLYLPVGICPGNHRPEAARAVVVVLGGRVLVFLPSD